MPKRARGITARFAQTAKRPGMFADGHGLYLQVTPSGTRSWVFRFMLNGRRRDMGLGSFPVVTLERARAKALEAKRMVAEGIDPLDARRAAKAALAIEAAKTATFRDCADAFVEANRAGWRNPKHARQWASTLDAYAYPVLGGLPVAAIDTGLVLKVLEPIWTVKTETASRVRGRIEAVLDYARVRGYRSGENPAQWKGHLDQILPAKGKVAKVEHLASLPYRELSAFWTRLQAQEGLGARGLEIAILTGCRSGEILGARWGEFDLAAKVWTIPAGRTKGGIEHRVPLSEPALAILRKLSGLRVDDHVLPGARKGRPLSNMAMMMALRRMGVDVTQHGFRSTLRTWIAERTAYPHEIAEAALGHVQGDRVVAAYQRGDFFEKRRRLMAEWAAFVTTPEPAVAVLPIRRGGHQI